MNDDSNHDVKSEEIESEVKMDLEDKEISSGAAPLSVDEEEKQDRNNEKILQETIRSEDTVDDISNHDVESEEIESEVKMDLEDKEISSGVAPLSVDEEEKNDRNNEKILQPIGSKDATNVTPENMESETVGDQVDIQEGTRSVPKSDGSSETGQKASKKISLTLEGRVSSRKRAFDDTSGLGYGEQDFIFRPVKRRGFGIDDNLRIGRIDKNLGPVSTNEEVLPPISKMKDNSASMVEMFDDAEEDNTFDFDSYKKSIETASTIRADLVAAILGSSSMSSPNVMPNVEKSINNSDLKRRRTTTKKLKKKSTEKERTAAVAIMDGEIDLLNILPKDDCFLLGSNYFIFTLRQLEWVLDDDTNAQDSILRQELRKLLMQTLRKGSSMAHGAEEKTENSTKQKDEGDLVSPQATTSLPSVSVEGGTAEISAEKENLENEKDVLETSKFKIWKTMIETWKNEGGRISDGDQFPIVDGPMSVFFPVGTLQFMESIKVIGLFDFLCLKKTESGLAVDMFRAWRKKCGLRDISLLPLAKHLTGINARIEACLKRKFDHEQDFINWVKGPMVVLSGAAKDFLVDHSKVFSGTDFIETKTKILADKFCDWRSKNGLSALRGSGNVAMVSAWKTQIKDELEIENSKGKVIPEEEIGYEIESLQEAIPDTVGSGFSKRIKRRKAMQSGSSVDHDTSSPSYAALNSPEFFAEYFRNERKLAMFKSVGISTVQDLLDASKGKNSDLLKALVKLKSEQSNGKEIQIPSCISLLYDWAARLKKKAQQMDMGGNKSVPKARKPEGSRSFRRKSDSTDPFDALSKPSKEFLRTSMNISTASVFLDTRTTDIANAFVKWRVEKGMPPLKGLGAVASISGWKKLVRTKAAAIRDSNLGNVNDTKTASAKIVSKQAQAKPQQTKTAKPLPDSQLEKLGVVADEVKATLSTDIKTTKYLSVLSFQKSDVFHFELETRKNLSNGEETYLRYLGNDRQSAVNFNGIESIDGEKQCTVVNSNRDGKPNRMSGRKPYDTSAHGSIELSNSLFDPGIIPMDQSDDSEDGFENLIKFFVMENDLLNEASEYNKEDTNVHASFKTFNVFEMLRYGRRTSRLYLACPMEKGQSVKLQCLPVYNFNKSQVTKGSVKTVRKLIQERLRSLPVVLLLHLLQFLKTKVAPVIDLGLNNTSLSSNDESQTSAPSSLNSKSLVARRRIHWVAVKIYESLRNLSPELLTKHMSIDLLWTKASFDKIPEEMTVSIRKEIRQEKEYEIIERAMTVDESFQIEDLKSQQAAIDSVPQLETESNLRFGSRSLANQSSLPFFFGFVWPLLKAEGWKLRSDAVPQDVKYLSPGKFGVRMQVSRRRDSVAKQRSQLAKQSSSVGLGYVPKLTRRVLIKCSEPVESLSPSHDGAAQVLSTKSVLEEFSSSLILKVGQEEGNKATSEQITKIQNIVIEFTALFNALVPLTFENKDEFRLTEGKQWCDILDSKYLMNFLIIMPDMLQEADIPVQQYSQTICVVHELLAFISNNHQKLFDGRLKLPNEEYHSEPSFPSRLPAQIKKFSQKDLELDLEKPTKRGLSESESVETILPQDQAGLTDFVNIVMSQAIIGRSTEDHFSRHGVYKAGHPFIVCRHCLGARKGGKFFYGTYDSIATAVTAMEKHILRCTEINDEVKDQAAKAKVHHPTQKKNLPFGSQSAFFVRLFDRMQSMGKTKYDPELDSQVTLPPVRKNEMSVKSGLAGKSDTSRVFDSHLDVLEYIQSAEPWKSRRELEKAIAKYYSCLDYRGKLSGAKKGEFSITSEWLYSKMTFKN